MDKKQDLIAAFQVAFLSSTNPSEIQRIAQKIYDKFIADLTFQLGLTGTPAAEDRIQASDVLYDISRRLRHFDHLPVSAYAVRDNIVSQIGQFMQKIDPQRFS